MWNASAAYLYILHLDPSALAWEYLRRNQDYRQQWGNGTLKDAGYALARWGCAVPENPDRDSREAMPGWEPEPPEVIHVSGVTTAGPTDSPFSLWSIPGHRTLSYTRRHVELQVAGSEMTRLRMDHTVKDGDAFAYSVRADASLPERLQCLRHFSERRSAAITPSLLPNGKLLDRRALTHVRTLQALDGVQALASQRDIAAALFGAEEVARRWQPDSDLRAQVRYLIRRGMALINGGYRTLLSTGKTAR